MTELSILIANRNGRNYLGRCLTSVQAASEGEDWEVVVVDNDSDDGSAELVAANYPWAKLLRSAENLGFARANNLALKESRGRYVLFLNPDTVIFDGAIDRLLDEARKDPGIGACGPALVQDGETFQVSFGRKVSFPAELVQKTFLNPYFRRRIGSLKRPHQVGWLSGACLLARREAVEQAGGFDERFFLYFEDIDLCLRMRRQGWTIVFFPAVKVYHEGGAATRHWSPSRYEYRRSQLHFYGKHNSRLSLALLRAYLRMNFFLLSLRAKVTRRRDFDAARFLQLLEQSRESDEKD